MGEAFLVGLLAGSSLILGGILAFALPFSRRVLGLVMAFGAGVLISAVAYELVGEAVLASDGGGEVAGGLAAGALTFFAGDLLIARSGGAHRKRSDGRQADGSGPAILLGIVLDGVPESFVLGASLLEGSGASVALVAAVFLSNVPEAIAASTGLERAGTSRRRIMSVWVLVALASGVAALAGYGLLDGASPGVTAFVLAYAGGAILTMLADTMMPEAFENAGRSVGLMTTLGFGLAFALTLLG